LFSISDNGVHMLLKKIIIPIGVFFALTFSVNSSAVLITNGFTYAVASDSANQTVGTHFHSNTGGSFGNPAGKAEVGRYGGEEVRGLSEYDLTGLTSSASAFVTFNIFKEGGLFAGTNDTPFSGNIIIEAYQGNNLENIADYQAPSTGLIGSFAIDPVTNNVGDIYSFDITSILNIAISNSWNSLGIRLASNPLNTGSQAWTFENFRLTSTNDCTGAGCGGGNVPEPDTLALLGLGLSALMMRRKKLHKSSAW
jgi:hypothetical protein